MSIPNSRTIPPPDPSPLVTISSFSKTVSLFLFYHKCNQLSVYILFTERNANEVRTRGHLAHCSCLLCALRFVLK